MSNLLAPRAAIAPGSTIILQQQGVAVAILKTNTTLYGSGGYGGQTIPSKKDD